MSILVKRLFAYNSLRNFSYIIASDNGDAWVIDPYDASQIKDEIKRLGVKLCGILNTHQHDDHKRGNEVLSQYFKCEVLDFSFNRPVQLDMSQSLEVLPTPGHTPEHLVFLWKKNGVHQMIFAGDTLFNAGVGNCKNGGNVEDLFATTQMLQNILPEQIELQPGHDYLKRNLEFAQMIEPENKNITERLYKINNIETELLPPTTLKEELLINPFFRLDSAEIQEKWLSSDERKLSSDKLQFLLFKKIRMMRDTW